jgi:hypothetical protein
MFNDGQESYRLIETIVSVEYFLFHKSLNVKT